jgi:O-antigen/teichoic acid export membrane protein
MEDSKNRLAGSVSWNTLTVVIQVLVQLGYTAILARLISPDSFALMGVTLGLVGFAEIFSQVGIGPALIQRKEIHSGHLNAAFVTSVLLGSMFTIGFFLAAPFIASFYEMPELTDIVRVVSLSFVLSALCLVPRSMMIKSLDFKAFFKASIVSIVGGNLVVGLTMAWLGFDIWAYVFALFSQNLLMTVGFWIFRPVRVGLRFDGMALRELLRYGAGSTLFNALNFFATKLDVLLMPKTLASHHSAAEMTRLSAMYERSAYVLSLPITVLGKLSDNVMFAGLSAMRDDHDASRRTYVMANTIIGIIVFPLSVMVVLLAEDIVRLYLGTQFSEAANPLRILFLAVGFRSLVKLDDARLRASDRLLAGSVIKLVFLATMAALAFWWSEFGPEGMAWAVVVATMVQFVLMKWLSIKLVGLSLFDYLRGMMPPVMLSGLTLLGCWAGIRSGELLGGAALVNFGLSVLLTGVLWIIAVKWFRFVFVADSIDYADLILSRLPNRKIFSWLKGRPD